MQVRYLLLFILMTIFSCKKNSDIALNNAKSTIKYATVFQLNQYKDYKILTIKNPFQKGSHSYQYVLKNKGVQVPDSLKTYKQIITPVHSIIVTSTTHIPALELLGVEDKLIGFPSCNYVSSPKTRVLIDSGKVKELNNNQALNIETVLSLKPDVLVAFGINGLSKPLQNLEKMQIPILVNGDWLEESALGKAEWIKFFGALFNKEQEADSIFNEIEKSYTKAKLLAQKAQTNPTVFAGALQGDKWILPAGKSWVAQFLKDANSQYLWADNQEKGSIKLSYENVLVKAKDADFWLAPGFYDSKEKLAENKHYQQFKAFQNDKIFSFTTKKGATGGLLYFELAPQRPDWVLNDLIHIFHPELLTNYQNHFFEKLP